MLAPRARTAYLSSFILSCGLYFACVARGAADVAVVLDGASVAHAHVYDGHGALSAGASSRLLWDYDEPYRSHILDYLFKPGFGASLHMLKVEIGGDTQSTDGTEPSHAHYRGDLSCTRGYEHWLLKEAKNRNPDILTYGLSWGVPHWVGNGSYFSDDNIVYQTQWAKCVNDTLGFKPSYIGIWNERSWGTTDYVTKLRSSLDHAGMADTQIALPDDGSGGLVESVVSAAETNATFNAAIGPIGVHYPCDHPMQRVYASGHKYWASEDYSTVADWAGAGCWGRELVRNFVRLNATSTIAWSLIWSVYEGLPYYGNGLMYAFEPWSGHYEVNSPIWTSAHWCQFTQPGWRILPVGSAAVAAGGSGALPLGGHYVTLVPADSMSEVTIVVETLEGKCLRCPGTSTQAQTLQIKLMGGLPSTKPLRLWTTNQTHQFKSMGAITPTSGTITLEVAPDSMYTLTTLEIGAHGAHDTPPPSAPFPLPYMEDFNSYANDTLARYFSDQGGSFSVFRDPGNASNGVLRQVVVDDPGANGWIRNPLPVSLIGGINASNYTVRVTARVVSPDSVTDSVGPVSLSRCISGKQSQQWVGNAPASEYLQNAGNGACLNVDGCGTNVITYDCVTTGGTCCGPECYDGLKWVYDSTSNTLTSKLRNACLGTSPSAPYSLVAQPCTGSPAQQWRVSATDHTILHTEDGLCLDAATPPTAVFVSACAFINDITAYTGGICLQVSASGNFSLTSGGSAGKVLASGPTPRGTSVLNWTFLELAWAGSGRVHASIDGTVVATTEAGTSSGTGFASVGSGWHIAEFDDFSLSTQG